MGKHEFGYARVERDFYPTPSWVVAALAEHVDLNGMIAWECACGDGRMASALRLVGCAHVHCSDIVDRGNGQDEVLDFLSAQEPNLAHFDAAITNPPFGPLGTLAAAFIESGLRRIKRGALLALLLPADFDSAKKRRPYFADCPDFTAKIVLNEGIVWFRRNDGKREQPKENHAWFVWERSPLRDRRPPILRYAPVQGKPAVCGKMCRAIPGE